jgi:hypothetical protein
MHLTDLDCEMLALADAPAAYQEPIDAASLAFALRIHPRTVQRWIAAGKLRAHRKGNVRSRWRVLMIDCERAYWEAAARKDHRMMVTLLRTGSGPRTRPCRPRE